MNQREKARLKYLLDSMGDDLTKISDDDKRMQEYRKICRIEFVQEVKLPKLEINKENLENQIKQLRNVRELMTIFGLSSNQIYYLTDKFGLRELWKEQVKLKNSVVIINDKQFLILNGRNKAVAKYYNISITLANKIIKEKKYKNDTVLNYIEYFKKRGKLNEN